ncbi:MAG TPA: ABC transporter permease [Burkholderiaceae bacterium]|nr:ABC transporter permease [Burkholderiaceae bacterium]HQR69512.1 ABC transporter permease [Burkholderiaceae bacterium]
MDLVLGQLLAGLSYGSTLFLVSAGLTLIFGVTRVVNFAHGALYMLGAYFAVTLTAMLPATPLAFFGGLLLAALAVAVVGIVLELVILRRIYAAPEIFQLLATFGIALVIQDLVLAAWGPEELFAPRAPGLKGAIAVGDALVPEYNMLLTAVGPLMFAALWWLFRRTRWGTVVRAATQDREMAAALGINERRLFTTVFALGAGLAGLAGALQIPRETVNLQMDLTILVEAFVVVVVGGLGSITGAFWASLAIGVLHAFGIWLLPQSTLVLIFVVMAVTLIVRPYGLAGRADSSARTVRAATHPPFLVLRPRQWWIVLLATVVACALPLALGDYALVVGTEMAILALFATSLQLFMGHGGLVSFGHAAFFGMGAYVAALLVKDIGAPFAAALALAPFAAGLAAALAGFFVLRAHGVYAAMLTLAFAQILWSIAVQWVGVTGGDNGLLGVWPPTAARWAYYLATLVIVGISLLVLRRAALAPFGFALRATRDAPERASALGINVRKVQWLAFVAGGAFGGLAGALQAFQKGAVFPNSLSIPVSVDALVMVLLGGLQTVSGPVVGAVAYHGLATELTRHTEYWRLWLGLAIVVLVIVAPRGIVGFLRERAARAA